MARIRRFQHGSLFKRGTRKKMWVARWWEDTIGLNGVLERVRRSDVLGTVAEIPTRRQAEQLLADKLRRVNSSDYRPQSNSTFRDFAEQKWKPEVFPTLKFSTKTHYAYMLKVHLYPAFGDTQLRLISQDAIQSLLMAKLRSGLSWKTVKHLRTSLGTIMTAAESWDLIEGNPVRKTRLPRRALQPDAPAIAPDQVRKLLDSLAEPSRSLASLLVFTGLRIGEALALRWRDVDLEAALLRVRQTVYEGHFDEPKTRRSNRIVPLAELCVQILAARKPAAVNCDALVFSTRGGSPLSRRNLLRRQLAPAATVLGIAGANWHWLRHAHATLLDAVGTPLGTVQALLGHSSAEVTREVYLHSLPADARRAVAGVEKLIGPNWTQVLGIPKSAGSLIQ